MFSIQKPRRFRREAWAIIETHFESLNLIERFTNHSNDEIAEILADCRVYSEAGGTDVRQFLRIKANERAQVYGGSHWQCILMAELADAQSLGDWIGLVRN